MNQEVCENGPSEIVDKVSFPKRIFFIISNEFCERFNFYGMRGKKERSSGVLFYSEFGLD